MEGKCIDKCYICGKERTIDHKWNGCKCERCGATRDEGHKWNGNKCERCDKISYKMSELFSLEERKFMQKEFECCLLPIHNPQYSIGATIDIINKAKKDGTVDIKILLLMQSFLKYNLSQSIILNRFIEKGWATQSANIQIKIDEVIDKFEDKIDTEVERNSDKENEKNIVSELLKVLIKLYSSSPKGEGFIPNSYAAESVREVGEKLNAAGGFQLMLSVHKQFAAIYNVMGTARNLEMVWDGIGNWRG